MVDPSRPPSHLDLSDLALPDHSGELWRVSESGDRPMLLVFHRHLM